MDEDAISKLMDHNRWLLNNGLVPDSIKNQLFMYGSLVHKDVLAVELSVNVDKYSIDYKIYIDKNLKNKIDKFKILQSSEGMWGLWKFKRLLKEEGNLNFDVVIDKFVKDYCGNKWSTQLTVLDYSEYIPDEDVGEDINYSKSDHRESN